MLALQSCEENSGQEKVWDGDGGDLNDLGTGGRKG